MDRLTVEITNMESQICKVCDQLIRLEEGSNKGRWLEDHLAELNAKEKDLIVQRGQLQVQLQPGGMPFKGWSIAKSRGNLDSELEQSPHWEKLLHNLSSKSSGLRLTLYWPICPFCSNCLGNKQNGGKLSSCMNFTSLSCLKCCHFARTLSLTMQHLTVNFIQHVF